MRANGFRLTKNDKIKAGFAYIFLTLFILILTGCGETDDDANLGSSTVGADGTTLYLKVADSNSAPVRSVARNSSTSVIATLQDSSGNSVVGEIITFTTDLGSITPEIGTGLTDNGGEATVQLTTSDEIGAGSVTAEYDNGTSVITVTYGFSVTGGSTTNDTNNDNTNNDNTNNDQTNDDEVSSSVTGSIEFLSASPMAIALRGTGGAGLSEFSTLKYKIIGTDGLPMSDKTVNFSLNTTVGGLDIDPVSAISNREGIVTTTVQAGSVPTSVRITATSTITDIDGNDQVIETQSDQLAVSTGIPDQNSMSMAFSKHNPEAWNYNGVEVDVTIQLADHFNNYVPDGTTVYFTAEGGTIEPSCQTVNSTCVVKWLSSHPKPADHRVTILATVLGNESFQDTNSDGMYTTVDGEAFIDSNTNNVYDEAFVDSNSNNKFDERFVDSLNGIYDGPEIFTDVDGDGLYSASVAENYTDANTNGQYDVGETFGDVNNNGTYDTDIPEPFIDRNGNGSWDSGEYFEDALNGVYDYGESFTDLGDGKYTQGEAYTDTNGNDQHDAAETYTDANSNGIFDAGDTMIIDIDGDNTFDEGLSEPFVDKGDGFWDENEDFVDALNGVYDYGEFFIDAGNGIYDDGEVFYDYNGNGLYDGAGNNPAGEASFTDSNNGNGLYDGSGTIAAGETFTDLNSNTFFDGPGYADLGEPFLDANENGVRDIDEVYIDTDNDGEFDAVGDGKLNSILCQENNNCSEEATLHLRATGVILMSGSFANIEIYDAVENIIYTSSSTLVTQGTINLRQGKTKYLNVRITDSAGQLMPAETTVSISSNGVDFSGTSSFVIGDGTGKHYAGLRLAQNDSEIDYLAGTTFGFSISDQDRKAEGVGSVTIKVLTEKGNESVVQLNVVH